VALSGESEAWLMAKTESLKSANGVWKRKSMASGERNNQRHQRRHGGVSKALEKKGCISLRSIVRRKCGRKSKSGKSARRTRV
jgi:hypothetical protein